MALTRIERLQRQGLSKDQILNRLNGEANLRDLTRSQLRQIGYNDTRIDNIIDRQKAGLTTGRIGNTSSGPRTVGQDPRGNGTDGPGPRPGGSEHPNLPQPRDPMEDYWEEQRQQQKESAFSMLSDLLNQYGLGSLSGHLQNLITSGKTDPATLQLELQNTKEWKERFKGNEMLRQKGLGVLSPAEYLNLERTYASVMRQFGLPAGFYDNQEDFVNFIGNGVSPAELAERATQAMDLVKQVDPTQRQMLASMYGVGEGDIAAFFLDAKKATPILQKTMNAVKIASAGKRAGLAVGADRAKFEDMADRGINEQMAQQGYGMIANEMDPLKNLSQIWGRGDEWTLDDAERATFFNEADAQRERKNLIGQERAAFSGRSGFQAGVSGRRSSAGSF